MPSAGSVTPINLHSPGFPREDIYARVRAERDSRFFWYLLTSPLGLLRSHVSEIWYYADDDGKVGPLTLRELRQELAAFSNAKDVLVRCDRFADWKLARDAPELKAQTAFPHPLPPLTRAQTCIGDLRTRPVAAVRRLQWGHSNSIVNIAAPYSRYAGGWARYPIVHPLDHATQLCKYLLAEQT
jgi:hypothetical protein